MAQTPQKTFFGHPIQLSTLFHIELWERFSFYGMQGILMIYLYYQAAEGGLGLDKALAGGIVGAYGGSVYLSTILGGWLADRLLGAEKTLFYSGIVVMLGHIALALIPGLSGLLCGLLLIALGSGGVKSSASSMVGSLYESEDKRLLRDAGFSIFYIAINIGGLFGPLLVGLLYERFGFHAGFGAAAVGMAFGLLLYLKGRKLLPHTPAPNPLQAGAGKTVFLGAAALIAAAAAAIGLDWVTLENFSSILLSVICVAVALYFVRLLAGGQSGNRRAILAYMPLFAAICLFWSIWFQIYTSVTVYFAETINRTVGGFTIPVPWKDSLQSFWVIAFSGIMAALWTKMGRRQPKTPLKFALSLIIVGLSYWLFLPYLNGGGVMPLAVFALVVLSITIAELLISPISLSLATKIAPADFKTQMVALNFLAFSLGFTLGGVLFKNWYDAAQPAAFYWKLGLLGGISGGVLLLLVPLLNKWLKGVD